jgi:hypothetical protein
VARDGLAHAAALGGVGPCHAVSGLGEADALEAHADARVVHQRQHVAEALAALADELGRGPVEGDGRGDGPVVPHPPSGLSFVDPSRIEYSSDAMAMPP